MSDTREDVELGKRYAEVKRSRDPFPCDRYAEISESIPLCASCGWDEQPHILQAEQTKAEQEDRP